MFKLIILILLGVSWVGLCIEGIGRLDDGSLIKKNVVIKPIDTIGTSDEGIARSNRGKNEPTLAFLLTYNGNNFDKKQKASTSKFETIHITNADLAGAGLSVQKKIGEQAILHKYQELLGHINSHGSKDKYENFGSNVSRYKNCNQQNTQLTEHVEPMQTNQKHDNILESIGIDSAKSSIEEHHHQNKHHHKQSRKYDDRDQTHSDNFDDESNPVSVSFFGESFETSGEISADDKQHFDTKRQRRITNSHDKLKFHPREQMGQKLIQKPVNLRSRIKPKRRTDQIVLNKSKKPQSRISAGPHSKLKPKHIPHHSHLKPLYIEPESVYSDSVESAESQSYHQISEEESHELPMWVHNRGRNYKSDKYKKRRMN